MISYRNIDNEIITEKCILEECIKDDLFKLDSSWVRITDALPVSGNVTIGSNGNWFVDGEDTGFKAQGPKGDNGVPLQPRLSEDGTKIEYSLDGEEWKELFPLSLITPNISFEEPVGLEPGTTPTVENVGDGFNVNLQFGLPKAPEVNVGSTTTIGEGNQAKVTNSGTPYAPVLNFQIPKGDTGRGITIKGFYPDLSTLQDKITSPAIGDVYCVGTAEPYTGYVWTNVYNSESQTATPAWQSIGSINKDTTILVNDFGNREDVGMTQKMITKIVSPIRNSNIYINKIISRDLSNKLFKYIGYIRLSDGMNLSYSDKNWSNTGFIKVQPGTIIHFKLNNFSSNPDIVNIAAYDYDKNYLPDESKYIEREEEGIFTVGNNTEFIILTNRNNYEYYFSSETNIGISSEIFFSIWYKKDLSDVFITNREQSDIAFEYLGYINPETGYNVNYTDENWKATDYIKVKEGQSIFGILAGKNEEVATVACYDKNRTYMKDVSLIGNLGATDKSFGKFVIPIGIEYVRICCSTKIEGSFYSDTKLSVNYYLSDKINLLGNASYTKTILNNAFEDLICGYGYIRPSDGSVSGELYDTNFNNTPIVKVKEGYAFELYLIGQKTDVCIIACYDNNKCYLPEKSISEPSFNGIFYIPEGVSYVRFCTSANYRSGQIAIAKLLQINGFSSVEHSNGYVRAEDGIIPDIEDDNWVTTDYINLTEIGAIEVNNLIGKEELVSVISAYNEEKVYMKDSSIIEANYSGVFHNPLVSYIRISSSNKSTDIGNVKFVGYNKRYVEVESTKLYSRFNEKIEYINESIDSIKNEIICDESKNEAIGYNYDINHFIHYGQSLSQGDWEDTVVSTVQKYNTVMFTGTPRVWEYRDQENKYKELVPAIENVFKYGEGEVVVGASYRGETPCCGTAEKLMQLISEEDSFDFTTYDWKILVSAPGMGGKNIDALSDTNGMYYKRLLEDVSNGKRLANLQGKSYSCNAVSWIQGEADSYKGMSFDEYYTKMESLFNNLNDDIKEITGQLEDVHFFLYQTDSCHFYGGYHYPYISLAQLKISIDKKNVHLVTPIYFFSKLSDNTHLTAAASKWFGGYFGIAFKRVLIDGMNFNCIYLEKYFVQNNYIFLKFRVPNPPLVFDVTNVIDRGIGKGFQIREIDDISDNSYIDIISNVEIIRPDMIKITCSENPIGKKLTYAVSNSKSYGIESDFIGGNLRDSQNIIFPFKENSGEPEKEHNMFNWCPIFEQILN